MLVNEKKFIADKLDYSQDEFDQLFNGKNKTFRDYKSKRKLIGVGIHTLKFFGFEKRLFR